MITKKQYVFAFLIVINSSAIFCMDKEGSSSEKNNKHGITKEDLDNAIKQAITTGYSQGYTDGLKNPILVDPNAAKEQATAEAAKLKKIKELTQDSISEHILKHTIQGIDEGLGLFTAQGSVKTLEVVASWALRGAINILGYGTDKNLIEAIYNEEHMTYLKQFMLLPSEQKTLLTIETENPDTPEESIDEVYKNSVRQFAQNSLLFVVKNKENDTINIGQKLIKTLIGEYNFAVQKMGYTKEDSYTKELQEYIKKITTQNYTKYSKRPEQTPTSTPSTLNKSQEDSINPTTRNHKTFYSENWGGWFRSYEEFDSWNNEWKNKLKKVSEPVNLSEAIDNNKIGV